MRKRQRGNAGKPEVFPTPVFRAPARPTARWCFNKVRRSGFYFFFKITIFRVYDRERPPAPGGGWEGKRRRKRGTSGRWCRSCAAAGGFFKMKAALFLFSLSFLHFPRPHPAPIPVSFFSFLGPHLLPSLIFFSPRPYAAPVHATRASIELANHMDPAQEPQVLEPSSGENPLQTFRTHTPLPKSKIRPRAPFFRKKYPESCKIVDFFFGWGFPPPVLNRGNPVLTRVNPS